MELPYAEAGFHKLQKLQVSQSCSDTIMADCKHTFGK